MAQTKGYNIMMTDEEFTLLIKLIDGDDEPTEEEERKLSGLRKKMYEKRRALRRKVRHETTRRSSGGHGGAIRGSVPRGVIVDEHGPIDGPPFHARGFGDRFDASGFGIKASKR